MNDVAGVAWRLARAQRRLGHDSVVFILQDSPFRFPYDVRIPGADGPLGWNAAMFANWRTFSRFDVIHVHGGLWKSQVFYPVFKRRFRWKPLVAHYHGSETRTGKGLHYRGLPDVQFFSTPDLASWHPSGQWLPNPIDLPDEPAEPGNAIPRFGHFVTNPVHKGTEKVIRLFHGAFGETEEMARGPTTVLRAKGAELWVVRGATHDDALRVMDGCDAIIDQIAGFGIYGMVAIEGMALGKPVLGTPNLEWYPDCPVVSLSGREAVHELRIIADDPALRRRLGFLGRSYVSRVHDSGVVARRVLRAYYEAIRQPAFTVRQAKSYWTRRGATYASELEAPELRERYRAQAKELLAILEGLQFDSVLDVGCGYGRVGEELRAKRSTTWVGADLSRDQLVELRRENDELGRHAIQASAQALPIRDSTFDLVLSVEMLMHIPPEQIQSVLRELQRIARSYIVHLDWYEDFLPGFQTGWNWMHDYKALWRSMGTVPREIRMASTGIQTIFVVPVNQNSRERVKGAVESSSDASSERPKSWRPLP